MTRFAFNDDLWREITRHVTKARSVLAAVAYFGTDGAELLPLKKGDSLVVDMSIDAVRQGVTNPSEIGRLMRRGVRVFSRRSLHAKFFVADNSLIAGSANISHRSKKDLDEAGIITTDHAAVRRARDFFGQLCTEPVGKEYLKQCIREYRPPRFKAALESRRSPNVRRSQRIVEAKLWFLGGLDSLSLSGDARTSMERLERTAEKRLKPDGQTELRWLRYWGKPKFLKQIRVGDWVVDCMKEGNRRYVGPPAQALSHEEWTSPRGTRYSMLMLETPTDGESMVLSDFRNRVKSVEPRLNNPNPRTRPILETHLADAILRMWTATGKVTKTRR